MNKKENHDSCPLCNGLNVLENIQKKKYQNILSYNKDILEKKFREVLLTGSAILDTRDLIKEINEPK